MIRVFRITGGNFRLLRGLSVTQSRNDQTHQGQRWISESEPELGIGICVETGGRVSIHFPASDMVRQYTSGPAPIKRADFRVGDHLPEFSPFKEVAILDNPEMLAGVTVLNRQITSLAPVLNSPTYGKGAEVLKEHTGPKDGKLRAKIDCMVKHSNGSTYIFAVEINNVPKKTTFTVPGSSVTVLDENRTIDVKDTTFNDTFEPWKVHIYQIKD